MVGRAGENLTVEEAEHHIAGYVVLNDFSARDVQFHEMRMHLGPAKGKDTATALGSVFVTVDELQPYRAGSSFDRDFDLHRVAGAERECTNREKISAATAKQGCLRSPQEPAGTRTNTR